MKILLVDDEKQLIQAISVILKQNNYSVDLAYDGEEGLDCALTGIYDLIVLDIMMPKLDGISLLKTLRHNKIDCPILMLTAKSETQDKIQGLNFGADDYITKPFDMQELLARIKALLRRKENLTNDVLSFSDIALDRDTSTLISKGNKIVLSKKEFQVLETLMLNSGKTVKKERLIEKIWGFDSDAEYNTIEVYISFLRKKLLAVGAKTEIKSLRGVGYMIGKNTSGVDDVR